MTLYFLIFESKNNYAPPISNRGDNTWKIIEALENVVEQRMAIAEKRWSPFSKTFSIPSREEVEWTDIIEGKWQERDYTQDELDYKETLKVQYGFDDKAARIIVKLKRNIYNNPKIRKDRKDYVFTRLLGGLSYGHEDNGLLKRFMWNNTAGQMYKDLDIKEQMTINFKLTESEYVYLKYKVRIQHENYGYYNTIQKELLPQYKKTMETVLGREITEDEFEKLWNKQIDAFKGKTDFSHQYITMATHLYGKSRLADLRGGHENTNDMSGWLGDTTDVADTKPSIGNDDYKADLDAVNIINIMKKRNLDFINVSNEYYNNLENGILNRAEEFKKI